MFRVDEKKAKKEKETRNVLRGVSMSAFQPRLRLLNPDKERGEGLRKKKMVFLFFFGEIVELESDRLKDWRKKSRREEGKDRTTTKR